MSQETINVTIGEIVYALPIVGKTDGDKPIVAYKEISKCARFFGIKDCIVHSIQRYDDIIFNKENRVARDEDGSIRRASRWVAMATCQDSEGNTYSGVGSSSVDNITSSFFFRFQPEVAERRAMSRAYIEALGVDIYSDMEVDVKRNLRPSKSNTNSGEQGASRKQIAAIGNLSKQIRNGKALIEKALEKMEVDSIYHLDFKQASKIISKLMEIVDKNKKPKEE